MNLSVSLPDDDVRLLDQLAGERGSSRSAVLQQAVALLRDRLLGADYAGAWEEWSAEDADLWESTAADGLGGS